VTRGLYKQCLPHAYNIHSFTFLLSVRSGKVKALMREAGQLKSNLPIHPNASILVRQVSVPVLSF